MHITTDLLQVLVPIIVTTIGSAVAVAWKMSKRFAAQDADHVLVKSRLADLDRKLDALGTQWNAGIQSLRTEFIGHISRLDADLDEQRKQAGRTEGRLEGLQRLFSVAPPVVRSEGAT